MYLVIFNKVLLQIIFYYIYIYIYIISLPLN